MSCKLYNIKKIQRAGIIKELEEWTISGDIKWSAAEGTDYICEVEDIGSFRISPEPVDEPDDQEVMEVYCLYLKPVGGEEILYIKEYGYITEESPLSNLYADIVMSSPGAVLTVNEVLSYFERKRATKEFVHIADLADTEYDSIKEDILEQISQHRHFSRSKLKALENAFDNLLSVIKNAPRINKNKT